MSFALALAACGDAPMPANESEVQSLKTQIASLTAQIDAETTARTDADERCDSALDALRTFDEDPIFEAVQLEIESLRERLSALETTVESTAAWINEVGDPLDAELTGLDDSIAVVDGRVSELESAIAAIETEVERLGVDVKNLDGDTRDLLTYLRVDPSTDAVIIEGANLFIQSGAGTTDAEVNGLGNLIVGYDEGDRSDKTGSHNLVVGPGHRYTGSGGVVFGAENGVAGLSASVLGGQGNLATGEGAVVIGGSGNLASAPFEISPW